MTGLAVVVDVLAAVCILTGVALTLLAAVGLLRFPDALSRMHAQSKPAVLGSLLILLGAGLALRSLSLFGIILLVAIFQLIPSPVGSHMLARAARARAESLKHR